MQYQQHPQHINVILFHFLHPVHNITNWNISSVVNLLMLLTITEQ